MNPNQLRTAWRVALLLGLAAALAGPLAAEPVPATATATTPGSRLVTTYSGFAGSP